VQKWYKDKNQGDQGVCAAASDVMIYHKTQIYRLYMHFLILDKFEGKINIPRGLIYNW